MSAKGDMAQTWGLCGEGELQHKRLQQDGNARRGSLFGHQSVVGDAVERIERHEMLVFEWMAARKPQQSEQRQKQAVKHCFAEER
jgi:hypothetical protein